MTDAVMRAAMPTKKPNIYVEALKEASVTAVLVFLLSVYMVGLQTQASQGQPLSFTTRFMDVVWACILVPAGRFLLALDRQGMHKPSLVGGVVAFVYLFAVGVLGMVGSLAYDTFPHPFDEPMVNIIFALGGVYIFGAAYHGMRTRRHGTLTIDQREAKEERRASWARRMSGILGPMLVGIAVVIPIVMPFSPWSGASRQVVETLILILTYVMLGWGLNIVVGLAGLLDLGYVAFYAVGAYTYAKLSTELGLNFWECLPLAGLLAATFGILLGFPVLRLRGDYLAIVTLGFGEMIRIILINWQSFTNGPNGIASIPRPSFFGLPFERVPDEGKTAFHQFFGLEFSPEHRLVFLYFLILALALLTNLLVLRLRKLPIGRAWEALREDEIACKALGINPTNVKLSAFAIGAMLGGFAGAFFATRQGFISPESFSFLESATILATVVLGGMGSQLGVVLAATVLVTLPEFGRQLAQFRMLLFA